MTALAARRKEVLDSVMRQAIYEGAVAVLTQHGLDGATMDRVAAAAGVAKGSLYNYFRNKQELLEFVHERAVGPMQQRLEAIAAGPKAATEKLREVSLVWRQYLADNQPVFQFLLNDHAARGLLRGSELTARDRAIQQVAAIIEQGIAQRAFRPVDAKAAAEMFVGASIAMAEQEFVRGQHRAVDQVAEVLLDVFVGGLAACR